MRIQAKFYIMGLTIVYILFMLIIKIIIKNIKKQKNIIEEEKKKFIKINKNSRHLHP